MTEEPKFRVRRVPPLDGSGSQSAVAYFYPRTVSPLLCRDLWARMGANPQFQQIQLSYKQRSYNHNAYLYGFVRLLADTLPEPITVIETGVLQGESTAFILEALRDSGKSGLLYSIDKADVPYPVPDLGTMAVDQLHNDVPRYGMVPEDLKDRWVLVEGDAKDALPWVIEQAGPLSLFHHDSLHTYEHMLWEFETAWPAIRPGGILASDDALWNRAMDKFALDRQLYPFYAQNPRTPGVSAFVKKGEGV